MKRTTSSRPRRTMLTAGLWATSLIVAASGTAYAAAQITGAQIKNGSVTSIDIKNGGIAYADLSAGAKKTLIRAAVKELQKSGPSAANTAVPGAAGAAGTNGTNGSKGDKGDAGTNGTNGTDGAKGVKGDRGYNADGTVTAKVSASGDAGFTVRSVAGTGGNNGSATITGGKLSMAIAAPGGGFAGASHAYDNVSLDELTALAYEYTKANTTTTASVPLKIDVTGAVSCTGLAGCANPPFAASPTATTLVFEPYYTDGNVLAGSVNTLESTSKWWATRGIAGAVNRDTFVSLQTIKDANPNLKIQRIYFDAGQNGQGNPWSGFSGTADDLVIGFAGKDAVKYDFG